MNTDFMTEMQKTQTKNTFSFTENGAKGYKSTGSHLLDLNFAVTSLRNKTEAEILSLFHAAYDENPVLAVVWLFYLRDVRGGLGERRTFFVCMKDLAKRHPEMLKLVLPLVSEYGRWDDLFRLLDTELADHVLQIVADQLTEDMKNMQVNKPISLLAKWMPSNNTSSKETRKKAVYIARRLRIPIPQYQAMLSRMRKYLCVVEREMSGGVWGDINYEHVPSRANLQYNKAFLRHDEERRRDYLSSVQKGEAKIHSSVLFPHDIVAKYYAGGGWYRRPLANLDEGLEAMWKGLPDTFDLCPSTIVVADGSSSMTSPIGGTSACALDAANALAIYFSQFLSGPYKDRYITFSMTPQFVDLRNCHTLRDKLAEAGKHDECENTNIEAVFDLILRTAVQNHLSMNDLPQNILILSDMEFDSCACSSSCGNRWRADSGSIPFEKIRKNFEKEGYSLPHLIFWNLMSRSGTLPVNRYNDNVSLISGFSANTMKMALTGKTDPYEALVKTLQGERYQPVFKALV